MLVDGGADYGTVSGYRWRVHEQWRAWLVAGPYVVTTWPRPPSGRPLFAHTLITGWALVDHRNGDGLDCTRANMRQATKAQNGCNRGSQRGSTSCYKGVCWLRSGKWLAQIAAGGRNRHIGLFPGTPEGEITAALAYDMAARELHGAFAWLNFPDGTPVLSGVSGIDGAADVL